VSVCILDSDVVIDLIKKAPPALAWLKQQTAQPSITVTTWLEIIQGARGGKVEQAAHKRVLDLFSLEYPTQVDMDWAMNQLLKYRLSHSVDANDCLIAAVAFRLNIPLYTRNLKHMTPVLGNTLAIRPYIL
jgi:predicted nucleic acid-binding protein